MTNPCAIRTFSSIQLVEPAPSCHYWPLFTLRTDHTLRCELCKAGTSGQGLGTSVAAVHIPEGDVHDRFGKHGLGTYIGGACDADDPGAWFFLRRPGQPQERAFNPDAQLFH